MKEETIFKGRTRIMEEEVRIECSDTGDIMIYFDGKPAFMLNFQNLTSIYRKAQDKRRKYYEWNIMDIPGDGSNNRGRGGG
jgi:hypothetical protein